MPTTEPNISDEDIIQELNNHQLKAGGLLIGGLNRRLEEKTTESRWFLTTSYRTFVRAKAALMEIKTVRAERDKIKVDPLVKTKNHRV
jgi:hypothetical protein